MSGGGFDQQLAAPKRFLCSLLFNRHISELDVSTPPSALIINVPMMLATIVCLFRRRASDARLSQNELESLDSEALMPVPSSTLRTPKPSHRPNLELQVALRTLLICSVVYLSVGFWIAHSIRKAEFVSDADEFCMHHVSQYCRPPWCELKAFI